MKKLILRTAAVATGLLLALGAGSTAWAQPASAGAGAVPVVGDLLGGGLPGVGGSPSGPTAVGPTGPITGPKDVTKIPASNGFNLGGVSLSQLPVLNQGR